MKLEKGKVYRLKEAIYNTGDGWLWVFEPRDAGVGWSCFRSVATGRTVDFRKPDFWFEEAEDEA